jgi:hypothetical protein
VANTFSKLSGFLNLPYKMTMLTHAQVFEALHDQVDIADREVPYIQVGIIIHRVQQFLDPFGAAQGGFEKQGFLIGEIGIDGSRAKGRPPWRSPASAPGRRAGRQTAAPRRP